MALPRIPNTEVIVDPNEYPDVFFNDIHIRYNGEITGDNARSAFSLTYIYNPFNYDTGVKNPQKIRQSISDLYGLAAQYPRVGLCIAEFISCLASVHTMQNTTDDSVKQAAETALIHGDSVQIATLRAMYAAYGEALDALYMEVLNRPVDFGGMITYLPMMAAGQAEAVRSILEQSEEAQG